MTQLPTAPLANQSLSACNPDATPLEFLNARRSTPLALLSEPGPSPKQLDHILRIASRVPDHRRVIPWRFIVFEGINKQAASGHISRRFAQINPNVTQEEISTERRKFECSPTVIALVSCPNKAHKTPVWEQELVAGAVGLNLLLAANASGFAGVWLTNWYAFDRKICTDFGLGPDERIAGFFHLGTARENPNERPRPDMDSMISRWSAG